MMRRDTGWEIGTVGIHNFGQVDRGKWTCLRGCCRCHGIIIIVEYRNDGGSNPKVRGRDTNFLTERSCTRNCWDKDIDTWDIACCFKHNTKGFADEIASKLSLGEIKDGLKGCQ
jgi:hypothetical protein